jgi:hypothetical protein
MRVAIYIGVFIAVLSMICGCGTDSPKNVQIATDRQVSVNAPAKQPDLPTFGAPVEGSIRVMVFGFGVKQPGYYFLPQGATVRDAFDVAQGTERTNWKRHYSGIVRQTPDGDLETIWFSRQTREFDESRVLENGDGVKFSHEIY